MQADGDLASTLTPLQNEITSSRNDSSHCTPDASPEKPGGSVWSGLINDYGLGKMQVKVTIAL